MDIIKDYFAPGAEIIDEGNTIVDAALESLSSLGCIPETDSIPAVALPLDFIDGLCPLFVGLELLNGRRKYHPLQSNAKLSMSVIAAGVDFAPSLNKLMLDFGLKTLSAITPWAAFANFTASFLEFIIASINFYYASKELDFLGWLDERTIEIKYLNSEIARLKNKIKLCKESLNQKETTENKTQLQNLIQEFKKLHRDKERVLSEISSRCRIFFANNFQSKKQSDKFEVVLSKLNKKDRNKISYQSFVTAEDKRIEQKILQRVNARYFDCRGRFIIRALSLTAMSLLLITMISACPPLGMISTSLIFLALAFFIVNYTTKAYLCVWNQSTQHNQNAKTSRQQGFFKDSIPSNDGGDELGLLFTA